MQKNNFIALGFSGGVMGVLIFIGAYSGDYLDSFFNNTKPIYTIIGSLLGVFIGLYQLFKAITHVSKKK
ncbi:MAG: AtpZ/AtpI family protein [Flavobacteriales bacterium]|jgi:F0F1-type ATP synthase assembly protein I|nr:AtpZ/AtpI family protein [Flavobacteriales bacterium]